MAGPFFGFGEVPTNLSPRFLGAVTWGSAGVEGALFTALNLNASALDKWTMTVSSTGPTQVSYTYNGIAYTNTISAASTAQGVIDALGALVGPVVLLQIADLVATSSTTWTATGKALGISFTMTATSNQAVSHTTTGSVGSDIYQGRGVMYSGSGTGPGSDATPLVKTVDNLTYQVQTWAITYNASAFYTAQIVLKGYKGGVDQVITFDTVAGNTSDTQTAADIATELNSLLPADTVLASNSSGNLILTSEVKGLAFTSSIVVSGTESGAAVLTYTTGAPGDPTTDAAAALIGIVPHSGRIVQNSSYEPVWQAGQPGPLAGATACHVWVSDYAGTAPSKGAAVGIYTGATNTGGFGFGSGAVGAGIAPLPRSVAQVIETDAGGNVGILFNPGNY